MSVHCIAIGYATREGVVIRAGDGYQAQTERTPIVTTHTPQVVEGEFVPCRWCGQMICECPDWIEFMATDPMRCQLCSKFDCDCVTDFADVLHADPHGNVAWRETEELPF
jgi:hypothetical protein